MEPRQPEAHENVAKDVTVNDRVIQWGKHGVYNNTLCVRNGAFLP